MAGNTVLVSRDLRLIAQGQPVAEPLQYQRFDWGDLATGTKHQLQAIGIGIGLQFPKSDRDMRTRGPRGCMVRISRGYMQKEGVFSAYIYFPGWPEKAPLVSSSPGFPGVKTRAVTWFDEHIGNACDLVAAGLLNMDHLPGVAGMRKTRVRVRSDGTPVTGAPTSNLGTWRRPGARWIEHASSSRFRVCVVVSEAEEQRRCAAEKDADREWRTRVLNHPRPAPLYTPGARQPEKPRQHLRLVWSAPA